MADTPIIAFAKTSSERDFLRGFFKGWEYPVIFFENETICFDNLQSIKPKVLLIRTDARLIVWRFVFALHALEINATICVVTNAFEGSHFCLEGMTVTIQCFPPRNDGSWMIDQLMQAVTRNPCPGSSAVKELLIGESTEIRRINASIAGLKISSDPVLISGEAGTGKELLARRIVGYPQNGSVFIKVDCSQICTGKMTLTRLDEVQKVKDVLPQKNIDGATPLRISILFKGINLLSPGGQLEILALLEDGFMPLLGMETSCRVIATTEADLEQLVKLNQFRQDLYYRLNVIPVTMPPLRQRREDIPLLLDWLTIQACARLQRSQMLVASQTLEKVQAYPWPGNVDELKRAVERFAISGNETHILAHANLERYDSSNGPLHGLNDHAIPDSLEIQSCLSDVGSMPLKSICDKFIHQTEKVILQKALEATKWNRKKAAELLDISYKSMLNKMKIYGIV